MSEVIQPIEAWRKCWREGFAPGLSRKGLEALKFALQTDDKRLIQGATTSPPPLMCVEDWDCEAADAIGLAGWLGDDNRTVSEVSEFFFKQCFDADIRLGERAASRYFLNWFDDTPRAEMRFQVLQEVIVALKRFEPHAAA